MADCQHTRVTHVSATEHRQCAHCGGSIPIGKRTDTKYCSEQCGNIARSRRKTRKQHKAYNASDHGKAKRKAYTNTDEYRAKARERMRAKRQTEEGRASQREAVYRWRNRIRQQDPACWSQIRKSEAQRAKARAGIYDAHVREWRLRQVLNTRRMLLKSMQSAHVMAFREYMRAASDDWHTAYWASIGKPWKNPRLPEVDAYRIRYRMDDGFRLQEINRQSWRKDTLIARDDGTINYWALLAQSDRCPYCGTIIDRENAVLDHVDPIKLGGENSVNNVVICCRDCNKSKAAKPFEVWLTLLAPKHRRTALAMYRRLKGRAPGQFALPLVFNE